MTTDELMGVCERALELAGGDAEVTVGVSSEALLRLAANQPIQHSSAVLHQVHVRLREGGRLGEAAGDRFDEPGLEAVLRRARAQMAALAPERDLLPTNGAQGVLAVSAHHADTTPEAFDAEARAAAGEALVAPAREAGLRAAGIVEVAERQSVRATANGFRGRYRSTSAEFSVTADSADSSGCRTVWSRSARVLDAAAAGREAAEVALRAQRPQVLEPGTYRAVLAPAAAVEAIGFLAHEFNARSVLEGRSSLRERMGQRIAAERVQLYQDVTHPLLQNTPYDDDSLAVRRVELVRDGVAANLLHDRRTAKEMGAEPTGYSMGGRLVRGAGAHAPVMPGEDLELDELLACCGDGIYVSRLWYSNVVDPDAGVLTAMTRDGTFRIRDGKLAEPLTNARFNQSVFELLGGVEALGRPEVVDGCVVPPMAVSAFTVSSGTSF